jgi:hypothetical protein
VIALAAAAALMTFTPNPSHFGELVTARVQGAASPSFAPFVVREQHGNTYVLQCLDPVCAPGAKPRVLKVAGTRVEIVPSTTKAEAAHPLRSFRRETTPPPTSYRIQPGLLRALLLAAAALLVAGAVALLWPLLKRLVPEQHDDRTPLERALDLVRASLTRAPADRRRALDLLARAVGRDRSRDALDLAWSRPQPDPAQIESLVESVERGKQ